MPPNASDTFAMPVMASQDESALGQLPEVLLHFSGLQRAGLCEGMNAPRRRPLKVSFFGDGAARRARRLDIVANGRHICAGTMG